MHGTMLSPFESGYRLCDILEKVRFIPEKKQTNMENVFVTMGGKVNSNS